MYFPDTVKLIDEVFILAQKDLNQSGLKITKIDSLIIETKIIGDLSSLLSENSTVFVKSYGKGSLSTASFRGTNASHTKVVWNNVVINSPMLGMVDMSQIPVSAGDNIILYHGAASLCKSANAIGGLIELSSLPIWEKGLKAKIVTSAGSYSSFDNFAKLRAGNKIFQSVSKFYHSISENNFPFLNTDITDSAIDYRRNADYKRYGLIQEFYLRTGHKSNMSVKFWAQDSDRGVPGLTTNESGPNNNVNRQNENMLVYTTDYIYHADKIRFEINHGGNYRTSVYRNTNYINGAGFLNVTDANNKSFSLFNSASTKYKLKEKTEITAMLNYNFHNVVSQENVRNESYDTIRHEGGLSISAFSSEIKNLRAGFLLRQDFSDGTFSPFIPSLSGEYFITNKMTVKASIARNYNLPGLHDLYYTPGGNPNLKPEHGISADGGINKVFTHNNVSIKTEAGINYSKIYDWILWRPTAMGYWTPDNIDAVVASGAELSINLFAHTEKIRFNFIANYSFTKSVRADENENINNISRGKQLPYIPRHSANLYSRISWKKFYFSYQWTYFSTRYTTSAAEPGVLVSIYPYFMNDISVGRSFETNKFFFDLNIKIHNLFNENYRSVLWQPMPGRNYSVQLTIKMK